MNAYRPWRQDWAFSAGLLFISALSITAVSMGLLAEARLNAYAISTTVAFGLGGLFYARRGLVRAYGAHVEHVALEKLGQVVSADWQLQRNIVLKYGDLDGLLIGSQRARFALEIKAQRQVEVGGASLLRSEALLVGGKRGRGALALGQAKVNADQVNATAVLWYPRALKRSTCVMSQVIVICGPADHLIEALGVGKKGWL